MINRIRNCLVFASALLLLAACGSNITVTSDWDPAIDFSQFKTVYLLEDKKPISPMIDQRIRNAIADDLKAKGLAVVEDEEQADMAVGYTVSTEERSQFRTTNTGWGGYSYHHSPWSSSVSASSSRTTESKYTVGTLLIAAFKRDAKSQIWQGTASGRVRETTKPEQSEQQIREAVTEAMQSFPPQ